MDVNDVAFFSQQQQQQQPPASKLDAVTTAILSILESRIIDILPALGVLFLTYNVVIDILPPLFNDEGDYGTISFVVFSYANLTAFFFCLKSYGRLPEGESTKKTKLKIAVWTFATVYGISATSLNMSFLLQGDFHLGLCGDTFVRVDSGSELLGFFEFADNLQHS